MQNSANNNKFHGNPGIIRLLIDTAGSIATHNRDIKKNTETIVQSCNTSGTKGEDCRDMLLARVDSLEKLVTLNSLTIKKLMNAARELEDGVPVGKVLTSVSAYSTFYTDQLKCEEKEAFHVLNMLGDMQHSG